METIAAVLAAAQEGKEPPPGGGILSFLFLAVTIFLIFWLLVFRPQQKEEARHRKMLEGLKKNDTVVTVGGIIGTVVNVKEDEIVLRVDDSTKTRIRFIPSKIVGVLKSPGRNSDS